MMRINRDRRTSNAFEGFSLLELMIVVAIGIVVTAMAIPTIGTTVDSYRLNSSGNTVAEVLQQARMAAVKSNQPYYVQWGAAGGCGAANIVCAVPASRFAPLVYSPTLGDPAGVISDRVAFQAAAPPGAGTLTALIGGGAPQQGGVIAFNARGMPCVSPGNPFICNANAPPFEWFMQSISSQKWEAVTVTPAGRIRSWVKRKSNKWE